MSLKIKNQKTKIKTISQENKKDLKKRKQVGLFALVGLAFLGIFNFNSLIDNYTQIGLAMVPSYIFAIMIYLFPFAFIIAEFASIRKAEGKESGLNSWIDIATTKKIAFYTSFLFWFANLTYFAGAIPMKVTSFTYMVMGPEAAGFIDTQMYSIILPFACILLMAAATWLSCKGTWAIGQAAKMGMVLILGLTILYLLSATVAWSTGYVAPPIQDTGPHVPDYSMSNFIPDFSFQFFAVFIWILMAGDGAQGLGVYVKDTKGGSKNFVKYLMIAIIIIALIYAIGGILVEVFPPESGDLGGGFYGAIGRSLVFLGIPIEVSYYILGTITFLGFAGVLMWTSAPVKVLFSEAPEGFFSESVTKLNKYGMPVKGAWIQFICVLPFFIVPAIGSQGLDEFMYIVKTLGGSLGMIPPLLIFYAYFNLRKNREYENRLLKVGGRKFGMTMAIILMVIFIGITSVAMLDTFYDGENWATFLLGPLANIGAIVIFFLPIVWLYKRYEFKENMIKYGKEVGLTKKIIYNHYSLKIQFKKIFNKKLKIKYIKEQKEIDVKLSKAELKKRLKIQKENIKKEDIKLTKEYFKKKKIMKLEKDKYEKNK